MSEMETRVDDVYNIAKEKKCDVIEDDTRTLLLDFDSEDALAQYRRVLEVVQDLWGIVSTEEWRSSSNKPHHIHIKITLEEDMPWPARICYPGCTWF